MEAVGWRQFIESNQFVSKQFVMAVSHERKLRY